MKCVILFNQVCARDAAGDLDVLRQCVAVEDVLRTQGWKTERLACSLNLKEVRDSLQKANPDLVFNLVESLGGTDRLMTGATILLESLRMPFTGSGTLSILSTTNKIFAKQRLLSERIPTPSWLTECDETWQGMQSLNSLSMTIVKAVSEHASLGISDASVITQASLDHLKAVIAAKAELLKTPHFAEQFIDGREFNLSVLSSEDGPVVLSHAEIEFVEFPDHKPRIVGHDAKWVDSSMESVNTPRRFNFPLQDRPLLDELSAIARQCWKAFDLRGYARVDFRVDQDGQPWVLEINANPCLSLDAGFAAAVTESGLTYEEAITRIVDAALQTN